MAGLPAQVAYFYQKHIHQNILKIIEEEKPDHVYCQLIRMAEYCRTVDIPKTLDYMDCFSLSTLKRAQHISNWKHVLWNLESQRVKKYEATVYPKFNHHTIISSVDLKSMGFGPSMPVTIVANGLNESYYIEIEPKPVRDIDILFLGNLAYFSNIEAVRFLVEEIMPHLDQKAIKKIVIAGSNPDDQIRKWVSQDERLELIENPEDTRLIYQRARLFVAPIFAGTGQQNKILEAIASGCIVICTQAVQQALGIRTPDLIHVQQTGIGFAGEIHQILKHLEQFQTQNADARDYIRVHFSWEKNTAVLEKLMAGAPH